ncbi:32990_t:CDS:2 [Gigaspora margarita]|uniref:32990_t:CDS:1 n=1 Tax=Gigaspora margarita TaxID=4874 RepID=A0ABN7VT49_GIGMA|nr:32990_t:CDS:2 [Gigaspora margarita]
MANSSNSITMKGNLKHASLNTVCHWVLDAWNEISEDIIVRVFKKYGILNCLSGSKDHLIYATYNESYKGKIEDFDDKSDKDDESDSDESNGNESDSNKSDSDESNNRVSKWPECFVIVEKLNMGKNKAYFRKN